jgi:hypothetical protein
MLVIWGCDKAEYFFGQDWTGGISLNRLEKFVCRDSRIWHLAPNGAPFAFGRTADYAVVAAIGWLHAKRMDQSARIFLY